MADWMIRARPVAVAAWHLLMALVIAYAFFIVLMVSSAQAGAAEQLQRLAKPLDYSAGHAVWRERLTIERRIALQKDDLERLEIALEEAKEDRLRASDSSWKTLASLHALQSPLSAVPACRFDRQQTRPPQIIEILERISYCLPDANVSPAVRTKVRRLLETPGPIVENAERWLESANHVEAVENRVKAKQNALRALEARRAELAAVDNSFSELSALQRSRMVGPGVLSEFPPSMTQILLAFVSGLFGSLLLTLVLIVYPKSELTLAAGKGYGPRILLGGLISVCVFVVIGGGTAVLGTDNAYADGESNFLAFCAIGILAGMFSDRVAAWLSDRADTFFKRDAGHQASPAAEGRPAGAAP